MAEQGIAGKAPYLAPEQVAFEQVSPATDVFALGAIMFEMFSGRRAFQGKGVADIMKKVAAGGVPIVSTVRPSVAAFSDTVRTFASSNPSGLLASISRVTVRVTPGAAASGPRTSSKTF